MAGVAALDAHLSQHNAASYVRGERFDDGFGERLTPQVDCLDEIGWRLTKRFQDGTPSVVAKPITAQLELQERPEPPLAQGSTQCMHTRQVGPRARQLVVAQVELGDGVVCEHSEPCGMLRAELLRRKRPRGAQRCEGPAESFAAHVDCVDIEGLSHKVGRRLL